ncbi:MAG: hypothetical protein KA248_11670 [Kiritimatiellae bacterium]|nr:hypothetical protein [Kiritimatiellia bacterium]
MSIYVELTRAFNDGRLRAVLSSGQAVVLHRLAIMSKDGDWILREEDEALRHVLAVLAERGGRYRFGAPMDLRWLRGGWSSHFEFRQGPLRVRTDFVTRPPRLSPENLEALWREQEGRDIPFVKARDLAELKKTNREKDYAVIGELARLLADPADQLLVSRSARDILTLAAEHPALFRELAPRRPALAAATRGGEELEAALDAERRALMHANEKRLQRYMQAAEPWARLWPGVAEKIAGLPLREAHEVMAARAEGVLPYEPAGGPP